MFKEISTGAFNDTECTCDCGNKHKLYGGIGYDTISCHSYTPASGEDGTGYYYHSVRCRKCGKISKLRTIGQNWYGGPAAARGGRIQ